MDRALDRAVRRIGCGLLAAVVVGAVPAGFALLLVLGLGRLLGWR